MQSLRGRVVAQHIAQDSVAWPTVRPCPRACDILQAFVFAWFTFL
jgi:hypothetical protein